MNLHKDDALHALNLVRDHYSAVISKDDLPVLVENWEKPWPSPMATIRWAIVWANAPYEWNVEVSHKEIIPRELAFAEPADAAGTALALYPPE